MDRTLLQRIYSEGSELISKCPRPPRVAAGWEPFVPELWDTITAVEEHRWFWRPEKVKFALLAESHVYTDTDDLRCKIKSSQLPPEAQRAPTQFVRLVYCLGYGNNDILDRNPIQRNTGPNEYWELLGRCSGTWNNSNNSLLWKVKTLEVLKEKGIWLADASIHACMDPRRKEPWRNIGQRFKGTLYKDLIDLSWKYVRPSIEEAVEIWYIGNTLKSVLRDDILDQSKFIPQPAGRKKPSTREEYDRQIPLLISAINRICG